MPPRRTSSARGRGRGGRRGRGGNASNTTATLEEDSQAQAAPTETPLIEAAPIETLHAEAMSTSSTPAALGRQPNEDSHVQSSTASTAFTASLPAESPAPTLVRPPVQRLDSLGLSGRGTSSTGRGVGGRVMAGKYKPKAVNRRALEDRIQSQQEEEEHKRERDIAAQREQEVSSHGGMQGPLYRGSGTWERGGMRGRGRGRGEAMGQRGSSRSARAPRESHGLFGVAPAASAKKIANASSRVSTAVAGLGSNSIDVDASNSRLNTSFTNSSASYNSTGVKRDPDTFLPSTSDKTSGVYNDTLSARIKVEVPDPIYPEEQEEGSRPAPRVDIELINLISDDENNDSDTAQSNVTKGKSRSTPSKRGLKPVRLYREEHKERVTLVNTEPTVSNLADDTNKPTDHQVHVLADDEDGDLMEISRDTKKWSGVWQEDEVETKHDPAADGDTMDVDVTVDTTTSGKGPQISAGETKDGKTPNASVAAEKERTAKRPRRSTRKQPVLQTEEDKAEHMRHLEDLRILAEELGSVQVSSRAEGEGGAVGLEDEESVAKQPRVTDHEGRLYLFQFPPALPTLVNKIKKEEAPDREPGSIEVETGIANAPEAIDLTKPDPEEAILVETPHGSNVQVPPEIVTEEGFVGKLIVRRSGRVQMEWGGVLLELGRGVQSDYLTTTMIIEGLGGDCGGGAPSEMSAKAPVGTGTGMGKVMGNFVLKPDFEAMGLM